MKRQFRVQIDFTIEVDESTIQLDPHITWKEPPDQAWKDARLKRQRNLFRALLAQPLLLQEYLEYLVFVEFETTSERTWRDIFEKEDEDIEHILLPAIATLEPEDQEWFTEAIEEEMFFESTEEFQSGFSTSWDAVQLIELTNIQSGSEE